MWPSVSDVSGCNGAGDLGWGRGGGSRWVRSRPVAIRRLGAVLGVSGRAPLRARGPKGFGYGRWKALPKPGVEDRGSPLKRRAVASDASAGSEAASGASFGGPERVARPGFAAFGMGFGRALESCPIMQAYRTSPPHDKRGGFLATQRDKAPPRIHHAPVIRADLDPRSRPASPTSASAVPRRSATAQARAKANSRESPGTAAFPPPAAIPAWARASGRAGEGDPLFAAGAGLALLDAYLRRDPPAAGALRSRLALQSAAASAKILRLNADEAALRDLRFAVGDPPGLAGERCLQLWRDLRRPAAQPRPRPDCRRGGAARPGCADPNGLAASLKGLRRGGDPVSAAAKAAALAFCRLPGRPSRRSRDPRPLGVRPASSRIRLRWPRPVPLIATKILDPSLRSDGGGRRPGLATPPGRTPPQARSRSPPPPPSTSPPILPAAPNTLIAVAPKLRAETGRRKSSTSCSPRIASRPPKPPATRR